MYKRFSRHTNWVISIGFIMMGIGLVLTLFKSPNNLFIEGGLFIIIGLLMGLHDRIETGR